MREMSPGVYKNGRLWFCKAANANPTHTRVLPTSGWTGFRSWVGFPTRSVGPARCTGPTDMRKIRPSTKNPVQPDVGGTLVWVGLGFAE